MSDDDYMFFECLRNEDDSKMSVSEETAKEIMEANRLYFAQLSKSRLKIRPSVWTDMTWANLMVGDGKHPLDLNE